jgi:hypothetical protein
MAKKQAANSAWIDVYIWTADLDKFEVGHAMAIAHRNPSKIYLNEFPSDPGIPKSLKTPLMNLQQTIAHYEGRQPSSIFTVLVPNYFRFNSVAANHRARKYWDSHPRGASDETNCSYAVHSALLAGGLEIGPIVYLPDQLAMQIKCLSRAKNGLWHNPRFPNVKAAAKIFTAAARASVGAKTILIR